MTVIKELKLVFDLKRKNAPIHVGSFAGAVFSMAHFLVLADKRC